MKLLPRLCAAIVTPAAFVLTINGAWAGNLSNSQHYSKDSNKGTGKQGSTTPANRMGQVSGKQPHKQAPVHLEVKDFSVGGENPPMVSQASATKAGTKAGKVGGINEIKIRPKRLTVHSPPK
jgi:hypothetical protein